MTRYRITAATRGETTFYHRLRHKLLQLKLESHNRQESRPQKIGLARLKKNIRVDPSILSGLITTGERNSHNELRLSTDHLEIAWTLRNRVIRSPEISITHKSTMAVQPILVADEGQEYRLACHKSGLIVCRRFSTDRTSYQNTNQGYQRSWCHLDPRESENLKLT